MSEGKRTPGPFFQAGHVILQRGPQGEEPKGVYPCDETVDLLNKGTHYDGMLEALKIIEDQLAAGECPDYDAIRAAIAAAEGGE